MKWFSEGKLEGGYLDQAKAPGHKGDLGWAKYHDLLPLALAGMHRSQEKVWVLLNWAGLGCNTCLQELRHAEWAVPGCVRVPASTYKTRGFPVGLQLPMVSVRAGDVGEPG